MPPPAVASKPLGPRASADSSVCVSMWTAAGKLACRPHRPENSLTSPPRAGATATVLPSGLIATSGGQTRSAWTGRSEASAPGSLQPCSRLVEVVGIPEIDLIFAGRSARSQSGLHRGGQSSVIGHPLDRDQPLTGRVREHAHHERAVGTMEGAERSPRHDIDQAHALVVGQEGGHVLPGGARRRPQRWRPRAAEGPAPARFAPSSTPEVPRHRGPGSAGRRQVPSSSARKSAARQGAGSGARVGTER